MITHKFLLCPHCKLHEFRVDHLTKEFGTPGTWVCDECGWYSQVRVHRLLWATYSIELTGKVAVPITLTLETRTDPPITFIVHAWDYGHGDPNEGAGERDEFLRYHYEESTCPWNVLGQTERLVFNSDPDPHGQLFRLVNVERRELNLSGRKP